MSIIEKSKMSNLEEEINEENKGNKQETSFDFGNSELNDAYRKLDEKTKEEFDKIPKKEIQIGVLQKMINPAIQELYENMNEKDKTKIDKSDKYRVFIKECNPVPNPGMQCIQVEHPSHMYLIGRSMIPTHNSFLVSAMALYELYRLISMDHPQARYGLMEFDEIVLLNVARNEEQAKKAIFSKIKQTVLASPYFQPFIGKDTELEMRFYTAHDRIENERREVAGINLFPGSPPDWTI